MGKTKLPSNQRADIVRFSLDSNLSYAEVALKMEITKEQVRYWLDKYKTSPFGLDNGLISGRPKAYGPDTTNRLVQRTYLKSHESCREVAKTIGVSHTTAWKWRREHQFRWLQPIPTAPLTEVHRQKRLEFAKFHLQNIEGLSKICFSDESTFRVDMKNKRVWRVPGSVDPNNYAEITQAPIGRMVWAAIGIRFKSSLILIHGHVNSQRYVDIIANHGILQELQAHYGSSGFVLQQDGATSHQSGYTKNQFQMMGIRTLPDWPSRSPDLSPIEQVWSLMKSRIDLSLIRSLAELDAAILEAWNSIDQSTIDNYVTSFPARLETCISVDGDTLNGHWAEVHLFHHLDE
jgi:transposase-like protein